MMMRHSRSNATRTATAPRSRTRWSPIPWRDGQFWLIQVLILGIEIGHAALEDRGVLVASSSLYLPVTSLVLIPLIYAALTYGLRGAIPTSLWVLLLTAPELIEFHNWHTREGTLSVLIVDMALTILIAFRVDRERTATVRAEDAGQRLSRLNATAAAVADSLDLVDVMAATLRASLDPNKDQVGWIQILPGMNLAERTIVWSSQRGSDVALTDQQGELATAACAAGAEQTDVDAVGRMRTVVTVLRAGNDVVGSFGITELADEIAPTELPVIRAIANQLGVAINNIRNYSRTKAAAADLRVANERLESYVRLATQAQEEERKRLSRELHDDTLQALVAANGQIGSVAADALPVDVRKRLAAVQAILATTVDNVRRYSRDLRPSLLDDLGLIDAIDWLVEDLDARSRITARLDLEGEPVRLADHRELIIFRVVQEALRNTERHSCATDVVVTLRFDRDQLSVAIHDNGLGFVVDSRERPHSVRGGLGLLGMQERTRLLAGTLTISSETGLGTTINLTVPLARTSGRLANIDIGAA